MKTACHWPTTVLEENTMNKAISKVRALFTSILRDTRGEDLSEKSSALSNGGKVVITAGAITLAALGAATLGNNTNAAGDKTSKDINSAVGAQSTATEHVSSAFSGSKP